MGVILCFFIYINHIIVASLLSSRSTGYSEVIVVVGGCERVGGFNLPYTECYDPVTGEWKSLAKLPEFTKSEYAVCALRNDILVSGKTVLSFQCDQSAFFFCSCIGKKSGFLTLQKRRSNFRVAVNVLLCFSCHLISQWTGRKGLSSYVIFTVSASLSFRKT